MKTTTVCYCFGPVLNSMNKSQITGRSDSFNTRLRLRALINRQVCFFSPPSNRRERVGECKSEKKKKKNLIHRFTHGLINHFTANRKICTGAFLARELTFAEAVISTRALLFRARVCRRQRTSEFFPLRLTSCSDSASIKKIVFLG